MSQIQASLYSNPYGRPDRLLQFLKELNDDYRLVNEKSFPGFKKLKDKEPNIKTFYDWGSYPLQSFDSVGKNGWGTISKEEEKKRKDVMDGGESYYALKAEEHYMAQLHNKPAVRFPRRN